MFEVTRAKEPTATVVCVRGEVDAATCGELAEALVAARTDPEAVAADFVVDVTDVSFIDSSGLRALLVAHQGLGEHRRLTIRGADATFRRILGLTGLDREFTVID